jgi:hypothetical protein
MNGVANHLGWVRKKIILQDHRPGTKKKTVRPGSAGMDSPFVKSNAVTPLLLHDQLLRLIGF